MSPAAQNTPSIRLNIALQGVEISRIRLAAPTRAHDVTHGVRSCCLRESSLTHHVQCDARNSAALNCLQMMYCAGFSSPTLPPSPPAALFKTLLRRFRN
ncbi:hypothetical protein EVAR_16848_1 [Eumeta japonica]|uniref:Uncharacterized protein n=1 Tax=Eumeta variegata TaxID=151549 RepID=A0A4C1V387_EUMVA|nr:hypothetical protein EVAR_16848_1 [Eumeta japonica]